MLVFQGGFVLFIYLKPYQNCNKDSTVAAVNSTGGTSLLPPALPWAIYIKLHFQQSSPGSQNSSWWEWKHQGWFLAGLPCRFWSDLKSLQIVLDLINPTRLWHCGWLGYLVLPCSRMGLGALQGWAGGLSWLFSSLLFFPPGPVAGAAPPWGSR